MTRNTPADFRLVEPSHNTLNTLPFVRKIGFLQHLFVELLVIGPHQGEDGLPVHEEANATFFCFCPRFSGLVQFGFS